MKHRREEDDLYKKFAKQREEQDKRIKEEIRVSTEIILSRLKANRKQQSQLISQKLKRKIL